MSGYVLRPVIRDPYEHWY
uniref:Uncharacterized protein n=1 Tax=Moniliophthora roreri TaxID=221103 RepID=A0A0W0G176_MONRR